MDLTTNLFLAPFLLVSIRLFFGFVFQVRNERTGSQIARDWTQCFLLLSPASKLWFRFANFRTRSEHQENDIIYTHIYIYVLENIFRLWVENKTASMNNTVLDSFSLMFETLFLFFYSTLAYQATLQSHHEQHDHHYAFLRDFYIVFVTGALLRSGEAFCANYAIQFQRAVRVYHGLITMVEAIAIYFICMNRFLDKGMMEAEVVVSLFAMCLMYIPEVPVGIFDRSIKPVQKDEIIPKPFFNQLKQVNGVQQVFLMNSAAPVRFTALEDQSLQEEEDEEYEDLPPPPPLMVSPHPSPVTVAAAPVTTPPVTVADPVTVVPVASPATVIPVTVAVPIIETTPLVPNLIQKKKNNKKKSGSSGSSSTNIVT